MSERYSLMADQIFSSRILPADSGGAGAVQEERKRRAWIEPNRRILDCPEPAPPLPAGFAPRIAVA